MDPTIRSVVLDMPWHDAAIFIPLVLLGTVFVMVLLLAVAFKGAAERRQRSMERHQRRMGEISAALGELTAPVREAEFLAKLWQGGRANDGDLLALPRHREAYLNGRQRGLYGGDIALAEARAEYRHGDPEMVRKYERAARRLAERIRPAETALLAQLRQHADAIERLWREQNPVNSRMSPILAG